GLGGHGGLGGGLGSRGAGRNGGDAARRTGYGRLRYFHRLRLQGVEAVPCLGPSLVGPRVSFHWRSRPVPPPEPEEVVPVSEDIAKTGVAEANRSRAGPRPGRKGLGARGWP